MKFSTVNAKCPTYNEKHILYVGTHTGTFKRINLYDDDPYKQINLQPVETLNKTSKITCMEFGNKDHTEVLLGRANGYVKVFKCLEQDSTSCFEAANGEVVGLGRSNGCIVVGLANGTTRVVKYPTPLEFSVGENLARLRVCPEDETRMLTGGKLLKQIIKLWDIETQKVLFHARNVRKDMLELEQAVWDNDVVFVNRNLVAACSRHGYVRLYDTRGPQRRPVQDFTSSDPDDQLSFSCLTSHGDYVYAGTTTFGARAFDIRKMKNHTHVYKGFTGTVTSVSVDPTGNHLISGCLDRYVRVHHTHRTALEYRCYVKSKPTNVLLTEYKEMEKEKTHNESDEVQIVGEAGSDAEYDELFSKMQTVKERTTKTNKRKASLDDPVIDSNIPNNGMKKLIVYKKKIVIANNKD